MQAGYQCRACKTAAETFSFALSAKYKINRGVCQGDPLSFELAIEPLAEMLRRSDLKGYRVPETTKKLITSLFADDTTVYLTAKDKFSDLQKSSKNGAQHLVQSSTLQKLRLFQ
jgi:hypothetical protein